MRIACVLLCVLTTRLPADDWTAPELPGGKSIIAIESPELLKATVDLQPGTTIAKTPPRVDVMYYPGQTYAGNPWSVWGDSLAVGTKYYSAIGDHIGPHGNAFVYEYDAETRKLRQIVDVQKILSRPKTHYTPGKIHSRIDLGRDGWLYFSTHRGSTRATTAENHFEGGWILRHHPESGKSEVVASAPVPGHTLPTSVLDPDQLVFYAGTANGDYKQKGVHFLAYDIAGRKVLYTDEHGPYRAAILARSTGRVYFQQDARRGDVANLVRFDPRKPGPPVEVDAKLGLRACTIETSGGKVYTVDGDALWEFDTKTEQARSLGGCVVADQTYIATLDIDPRTERYLYYCAGAHGGSYRDGTPIVQYDLKTKTRKVVCFLHPVLHERTGYVPIGTYGLAVAPDGATVYVTWNGNRFGEKRGKYGFDTCAMTAIHIPASERKP